MPDFTVVCNEHNNPPESIEAGNLILDLYLNPETFKGDIMALPTRLTIAFIESCIHDVQYHLLHNTASKVVPPVTVCHVMLKNGKSVVGLNYGAIDPELHSAEQGEEYAYKQAIDKLFELEGYSLINEHHKQGTGLLVENEEKSQ